MSIAICCPDLEKLISNADQETGLGLIVYMNKRSVLFFLAHLKHWTLQKNADSAIQIAFCPYCGSKLHLTATEENPNPPNR